MPGSSKLIKSLLTVGGISLLFWYIFRRSFPKRKEERIANVTSKVLPEVIFTSEGGQQNKQANLARKNTEQEINAKEDANDEADKKEGSSNNEQTIPRGDELTQVKCASAITEEQQNEEAEGDSEAEDQFEKIKRKIEEIIGRRKEGELIYIFIDFDDTLFYKKGFGKLMAEGEYEKAYQLPLIPTHVAIKLFKYLPEIPDLPIHMLSKREESSKIRAAIEGYWQIEGLIAGYHNQRNEQVAEGKTKSISKGEIIQEFITLELLDNKKIAGIVLIDDIQENLSSLLALKNDKPFDTLIIETYLHICDN